MADIAEAHVSSINWTTTTLAYGQTATASDMIDDLYIINSLTDDEVHVSLGNVSITDAYGSSIINNNSGNSSTYKDAYIQISGYEGFMYNSSGTSSYSIQLTLSPQGSTNTYEITGAGGITIGNSNGDDNGTYLTYKKNGSSYTNYSELSLNTTYTSNSHRLFTASLSGNYVSITRNSTSHVFSDQNSYTAGTVTITNPGATPSNSASHTITIYVSSDAPDPSTFYYYTTSVTPNSATLSYGSTLSASGFKVSGELRNPTDDKYEDDFNLFNAALSGGTWDGAPTNNVSSKTDTTGYITATASGKDDRGGAEITVTLGARPWTDGSTRYNNSSVDNYEVSNHPYGTNFSISTSENLSASYSTIHTWRWNSGNTSWQDESPEFVTCTANLNSNYNRSNVTSDFTDSVPVTIHCGTHGDKSGTLYIDVHIGNQPDYITLGETSVSLAPGSSAEDIEVFTNLSSVSCIANSGAGESTYVHDKVSVSYNGGYVSVSCSSTYAGSSGESGTWKIGNSSTYATLTVTVTGGSSPTYSISASPSVWNISDPTTSDSTTISISHTNLGDWTINNTDLVQVASYITASKDNENQITLSYNGNYSGTDNIEGTLHVGKSIGSYEYYASITITISGNEVTTNYQWIYVSASFDNYSVTVPYGTNSHTVGLISGSYRIKEQQSVNGGSWTDTGNTDDIIFSNGSLDTSFTRSRSSGDYSGSKAASVTVQNSSVGSSHTFNGNASISIIFENEQHTYSIRIASPSDNAYVWYQYSSGHSLYQPLASSDFTIYLTTDGVEGNTNIASNCNFSYTESGGGSYDGLPSKNDTSEDIDYAIYAYWNSDHSVWDEIDVTYEAHQEQSEYPKYQYIARNVVFNPDTEYTSGSSFTWRTYSPSLSGGTYTKVYQSQAYEGASWVDESSTNETFSGGYVNSQVTVNVGSSTTVSATATDSELTLNGNVTLYAVGSTHEDSYTLECTTNPYNSSTNGLANGSSLDKSGFRFTLKKNGSVEQSNIAGNSNVLSWNPSSWTNNESSAGTKSFTVTHTSHNEASTSVTIYYKAPAATATISWRATDDTTILNIKYFYYDFTPSGSPKGTLTFSDSYAEEGQHVLFNNYGWVAIRNKNTTSQTRTTNVTVAHGSNSNVTSQLTVKLPPPGFSINVPYWYNNPCAYTGYGYGHVVVQGAKNEAFELTLDNINAGDGFTYSFSSSSVVTTYSGNTGSSGSVEVPTYEITKNQNTGDDYGYAMITAVGTPNTRTDTTTIHRVHLNTELSMMASPTSFTSAGGSCSLTIYSIGYDNTSFEIIGYSDTAAMIQNHTSYVDGTRRSTLSINILENTSTSNRKVTINCLMRGTKEGDDYESEITRTVTLTQSGRGLEAKIILTPSSLTFQPTDNGNSKKQQVIVNSGDYNWTVSSDKTWWDYDVTSGTSGSAIYIWPTSEAPADTTRSGSITFTSTGGSNITGTLTILQTANSRILGFGHATDTTQGWDIADADFTGVSTQATGGWTYNSSTRTLTINIPAESTRQDLTVRAVYKVISRFIGWDMTIQGEQPDWLRVSPNKLLYNESSTNSIATSINVIADDYNYQADPSCYDVPRSATYVINSNLKKN